MELKVAVVRVLLFYFIYSLQSSAADTLQYFYTAVTSEKGFPVLSAAVQLNGEPFLYYDSIRKLVLKTEWIQKLFAESDYLVLQTEEIKGDLEDLKRVLSELMNFHNHKQVHTMQRMYGCELNDDQSIGGFERFAFDGEDFIGLNMKTLTWTAYDHKAQSSKTMWDRHGYPQNRKHYLENICINDLRKYVSYGRAILERRVPPEVKLFQQRSSHPELVCHATGFFPKAVVMSWEKDGEKVKADVKVRETLPNQDGSFQKRISLRFSLKDLQNNKYTCVIQHSSLKEDLRVKEIRITGDHLIIFGHIVNGVVDLLFLVLAVVGILMSKKKKNSGFKPVSSGSGNKGGDSATNGLELQKMNGLH